jgi:thymidylate kinase
MSSDGSTTLERDAPELLTVLADEIRVLNDRTTDGRRGGGDVDCAVRGVRPRWPLRLRDWQLCQALWYDVTAHYYVLVRGDDTLALDVVDDPSGIGKYRFATNVFAASEASGSLAPPADRAAYLTLKRIFKRSADPSAWDEIRTLATDNFEGFRRRLENALGSPLAEEISGVLRSERTPDTATVERWRRTLRKGRASRLGLARARLSATRILERVTHPTGLVVAVVGPDGSGKSTLTRALPDACGQLFRRSLAIHFRPGILPRPGKVVAASLPPDPTRPHARPVHGSAVSLLLLAYYWLDFQVGHALKVAPTRARSGLVVVERGFLDLAVDPTRYRLKVSPRLVHVLSRLLPSPDLTIVLDAGAEATAERKSELPLAEIVRQSETWRALAPRGRSLWVDSSQAPAATVGEVRAHITRCLQDRVIARTGGGWAVVPSARNPRLYLPRRPRTAALAGLDLATPSKGSSRLGLKLFRTLVSVGGLRGLPPVAPPAEVRCALAPSIPAGGTIAVRRSVHRNRHVAAILDSSGAPVVLVKLATDELGRGRLRMEQRAIERWVPLLAPPLRGPRIVSVDDGMLVFDWVSHDLRPRPWFLPVEVANGLGRLFAAGATDGPDGPCGPAHGDAAPWNFLSSGGTWTLVDWEVFMEQAPPFFDVFHYLVQAHSLLGRPERDELLAGVRGRGWVGDAIAAYGEGAGVPLQLVPSSFQRYLEHTSTPATMRDMNVDAVEVRRALIAYLSA